MNIPRVSDLDLKIRVGEWEVSTVALPLVIADRDPYETMVFEWKGDTLDFTGVLQVRHDTEDEARKFHKTLVELIRKHPDAWRQIVLDEEDDSVSRET